MISNRCFCKEQDLLWSCVQYWVRVDIKSQSAMLWYKEVNWCNFFFWQCALTGNATSAWSVHEEWSPSEIFKGSGIWWGLSVVTSLWWGKPEVGLFVYLRRAETGTLGFILFLFFHKKISALLFLTSNFYFQTSDFLCWLDYNFLVMKGFNHWYAHM